MRYQLDEDKGDLLYEVENDNLILKIKQEVIARKVCSCKSKT